MAALQKRNAADSLPYMPGLDGLRAVAVLAVFLYHVGFPWAAGGFLGVETFFVLSGYLITSLLLRDYRNYGRIRLGRFWLRRARRLWPALWLLLLGTLFLARFWAPDAWLRLREDLPAALTYTTNLLYIFRQVPYFERFGRPPLLQHLWSLAVEEQFYLFWPLLLWGFLRMLRVKPGREGEGRLALAVSGLAVFSTLWMAVQFDPLADPIRLYYGTDTRAAGFLLGGVLAVLWPPGGRVRVERMVDGLGWLGLVGLLALYHFLDEFQGLLYRGGFLVTAVASGLVVLAAASPRTTLSRVLGHPWPRWVGTRSYAIYLWHWPLIAVFRPGFEVDWSLPVYALVFWLMTCLAAEVSYRMVEHPIRHEGFRAWGRRVWALGRGWGTALGALILVLGVAWSVKGMAGHVAGGSTTPTGPVLAAEVQAQDLWGGGPSPGNEINPTEVSAVSLWEVNPEVTPSPAQPKSTPFQTTGTVTPTLPLTPLPEPWVTVIGDSVLQASVSFDFWTPWGEMVVVDALADRSMRDVPALAEEMAAQGRLAPVVVLHLGTDSSFDAEVLDQAMEALLTHEVQRVFLVNVRGPVPWEDLVNRSLKGGALRWPQADLLDWHALALEHPEWFVEDGAHLRYVGSQKYVEFIVSQVWPVARAVAYGGSISSGADQPSAGLPLTVKDTPTSLGVRLTLLGDSIMKSTLPVWEKNLPPGSFVMEAEEGRRMAHLLEIVPQLEATGRLAPVVVIHLGTNGAFTDATFDAVMDMLLSAGVERVFFVNVRSPIRWAPLANERLAAGVARWAQAELLDWNAYATPHRDWFYDDFAHPNQEGAREYVRFILSRIDWAMQP